MSNNYTPIATCVVHHEGKAYVGIRTSDNLYALTVEQARTMALNLLDHIEEAEAMP